MLLAVLIVRTPAGSPSFVWIALALSFFVVCHATYWIVTHPVNSAWLKDTRIGGAWRLFFGLFAGPGADWTHMRNVWEWSHVARAGFAMLAFLAIAVGLVQ